MPTNKVVLKTVDEFMSGYTPIYNPLYSILLGKSRSYPTQVGVTNLREIVTVGDIRAKHITPKDTEIKQVNVSEDKKVFKKYFFGNQFQVSTLQDQEGIDDVTAQVLDEHQKQMDELVLFGEGSNAGSVVNNGLFYSSDANYTLEASEQIALSNRLYDFHNKVITTATKAKLVAGRKVIVFYGTGVLPLFNSLYETAVKPWKVALQEVLGSDFAPSIEMPAEVTPNGANGWMIINLDQLMFHYTRLPSLDENGTNAEKKYHWMNFLMGSCMVEVKAKHGIIRQPVTLEVE